MAAEPKALEALLGQLLQKGWLPDVVEETLALLPQLPPPGKLTHEWVRSRLPLHRLVMARRMDWDSAWWVSRALCADFVWSCLDAASSLSARALRLGKRDRNIRGSAILMPRLLPLVHAAFEVDGSGSRLVLAQPAQASVGEPSDEARRSLCHLELAGLLQGRGSWTPKEGALPEAVAAGQGVAAPVCPACRVLSELWVVTLSDTGVGGPEGESLRAQYEP